MNGVPSDKEREIAKDVGENAMVMGWQKAITIGVRAHKITRVKMENLLDEVAAYNQKADPQGRIDELEDWLRERQDRSRLKVK